MENILKVFLMAFPEWLACIFMVVGDRKSTRLNSSHSV